MLATDHRLRESDAFRRTVRSGRRAGSPALVVHLRTREDAGEPFLGPVRVGLVVSKSVGGAVVRTQVKRRLRHLLRDRLATVPTGSDVVVRALPSSAGRTSAELAGDLDRCLERIVHPSVRAPRPTTGPTTGPTFGTGASR